jgi:hypothetical protein
MYFSETYVIHAYKLRSRGAFNSRKKRLHASRARNRAPDLEKAQSSLEQKPTPVPHPRQQSCEAPYSVVMRS